MSEKLLLFGTWEADVEPEWTRLHVRKFRRASSEVCGCPACKLWAARRGSALCEPCRMQLERLGVDLAFDTGQSPVLLDREMLYLAQYRVKGTVHDASPGKQFACPTCKTKILVEQDRMERQVILVNVAATLPLDPAELKAVSEPPTATRPHGG